MKLRTKQELILALSANGFCELDDSDDAIVKKIEEYGRELKQLRMGARLIGDIANDLGLTSLSGEVDR